MILYKVNIPMRFSQRHTILRQVKLYPLTTLCPQFFGKPYSSRQDLAILLQSCISRKCHYTNLYKIHSRMIVCGHASDTFLNNILLNAYSRFGHLQEAQLLFDRLIEKNLVSWSTLISMYSQHGHRKETLTMFLELRRSFIDSPNEFILGSVLSACVQFPIMDNAQEFHCYAVKIGLNVDIYVGTALVNLYLKAGYLNSGKLLFDELPVKNSVTWTTIISGYSQNGNSEAALAVFRQMKETGVHPDRFVISSVISICSALCFFEGGRQIHGYAYRKGMELDISVSNVLIDFYAKCCRVKIAERLFGSIPDRNIVSWTTMIAGYMQNSYDFEAMGLFRQMGRLGWKPDAYACTSIITSCGNLMALQQGKQVHAYAVKSNLVDDDFVKNGLVDMYAKCNCLVHARAVFDAMKRHNLVSYNAMIKGYASQEELAWSVYLFNRMRCTSFLPSPVTFVSILGISASQDALILTKQFHGIIMKSGFLQDLYSSSALINAYSKCSFIDEARSVFEEMQVRDVVAWNAMICGYTQNAEGEKAIQLYQDLHQQGMKPNEFTFVPLVKTTSNFAVLFQGLQLHVQTIKAGLVSDPLVSNALADMYAKCGAIKEAMELFDTSHAPDVVCWNSLISRFAEYGHAEEALMLFHQMQSKGIKPNHVTFLGVLSACNHAGLVVDGLLHFNSMKSNFNVEPGIEHYACIVGLLSKAGKLQEAKEFIEKMPIEPSAIMWRSLLAACKVFGDVGLGKYAAKMAIMLEPKNSGSYILLSNIFASMSMWTDVEKLQKEMDFHGVVKESGCSWIEVDGKVHAFVSKSTYHPESKSIYFVLDGLTELIKDVFWNSCSVDEISESG